MSDIVSMRKAAEAIADQAMARTTTAELQRAAREASLVSLAEAIDVFQAHAQEAQRTRNGRELALFESRPDKIGLLVGLLMEGNYRSTAAQIVGITMRAVRGWMEKAEAGDERYLPVADVILRAEAIGESDAVRNVRKAGSDARFWPAEMTFLERKHPERWGRRVEDANVPRVFVQIGIKDSDVSIGVGTAVPQRNEPHLDGEEVTR